MRLTDLNPRWIGAGGSNVYNADGTPITPRHGIGLMFSCPCGNADDEHDCYVRLSNPLDGGPPLDPQHPIWHREGEDFDTLTLTPSILRTDECKWHGFITNGNIVNA